MIHFTDKMCQTEHVYLTVNLKKNVLSSLVVKTKMKQWVIRKTFASKAKKAIMISKHTHKKQSRSVIVPERSVNFLLNKIKKQKNVQ
jgi:hypothetical protein